jgi:hypothetical protein
MKQIELTQGKFTLVDDDDFVFLSQFRWVLREKRKNTFYAVLPFYYKMTQNTLSIQMHAVIMNVIDPDIQVDHIDGNGLNNQKNNLRLCTHQQNQFNQRLSKANSSGYKGVYWCSHRKRWIAQISINKKPKNLGGFLNKEEAAKAYNEAAILYYGEFAKLNEI